jgi:hypothetical protein
VTKLTLRLAAGIAMLCAGPLVAASPTMANAWEYCRRDITGHMLGCSFSSMAQCEATRYGLGGDCLRDPFLPDARGAYAYQAGLAKRSTEARRVSVSSNSDTAVWNTKGSSIDATARR